MGGGTDGQSVVYKIMSFENRQLFYLINNTPTEIKFRSIDSNRKKIKLWNIIINLKKFWIIF